MAKFIKVCESAYTRWLTHGKTNNAINVSYVPLCIGLEEDAARGDAVATSFPFVGTMLYMADVFKILDRFATITQKSAADVDLSVFYDELPGVIAALKHMVREGAEPDDGYLYHTLQKFLDDVQKPESEGGPGFTIKGRSNMKAEWLEGARKQLVNAVIKHLEARFPDQKVMRAMYTVFDVNNYPESPTELKTYLFGHVETITQHYAKATNVIQSAATATDQFMPGASGTTGLAASLRARFRGVKKEVDMTVTSAETPEFLADNPYYLPAAAPTKKTVKQKRAVASFKTRRSAT